VTNRSSGRKKQAGKTIENRTQPELVPNPASKSNIVRGAPYMIASRMTGMHLGQARTSSQTNKTLLLVNCSCCTELAPILPIMPGGQLDTEKE
jgi:hypothetical protein